MCVLINYISNILHLYLKQSFQMEEMFSLVFFEIVH